MTDQVNKILVPDIGAPEVDVIEILVSVGDTIAVDDSLVTLEGDKASMDIPASAAGVIDSIEIAVGDKVSEGAVICVLKAEGEENSTSSSAASDVKEETKEETKDKPKVASQEVTKEESAKKVVAKKSEKTDKNEVHAGPAVRRLAHDLDLNLADISGSGEKGRITKEDVKSYLSAGNNAGSGLSVSKAPSVDFSKFGDVEFKSLSKIQKLSGANLHRNWVSIPHVTQFGEADISDMESFRQANKEAAIKQGYRLTPLVFIMKAVVAALKAFPHFNASLDASGESLVLKKYFHIGVAVDTPNGLVVPVIRDVDQKSLSELAKELGDISVKARDKGLSLKEMQGGCFTISSLGGIGGTAFTPIINAPEVAILGVSKSSYKAQYQADGSHEVKFMLPLSLSYDHRVIDGADGARFMVYLSKCLTDIRTLLL